MITFQTFTRFWKPIINGCIYLCIDLLYSYLPIRTYINIGSASSTLLKQVQRTLLVKLADCSFGDNISQDRLKF